MTREDIIRMVREAHRELVRQDYPGQLGQLDFWTMRLLERFAALVAAAEREACAKVCDEVIRDRDLYLVDGDGSEEVLRCAAAIRSRGEVKP